ncbi:DUF305 domain-containing protein [Corynebacterium halotolerans]|uniref:DUF305 domain-containing protein n=1 Tax=Corynebacterium halotolerans YIM 70093 = DSM 44683 TaxID=1121362 RepID=M1NUX5_9CORY|nr:DUF305 domain-containing protein [Corynebacterium halotolerans]AGF73297.1 hypothetical protein A605_11495 [Corynebacterium halotolerans YIM 70093 = DSM 44683]
MRPPTTRITAVLLATATALVLSACGAGADAGPPAAEQVERSAGMPDEANDTDVHFLGMMVPHHQQAIDMSETLLADPRVDPAVRDLAERIRDGQQAENDRMNAWAGEWGQQEAMEYHSHHLANGMFNPTVLGNFAQLEGEELQTRFLKLMHFHHAEVIAMTQDEVDNGGYPPLTDLAARMIEVQTAEMAEMEELLGYVPSG